MKILVQYVFEVPAGAYCWLFPESACQHFDNEGGGGMCTLGFGNYLASDSHGYIKPDKCKVLIEVQDARP